MARLQRTAATILTCGDYFSLSQRTNTEAFSGYYQFTGGRADYDDEPFLDIAQREVLEETGLDIPKWRFVQLGLNPHDNDCDECMMFHVELVDFESPRWIEKDKQTDWKWYCLARVKELKLIDGVQDWVDKVWQQKQLTATKNPVK